MKKIIAITAALLLIISCSENETSEIENVNNISKSATGDYIQYLRAQKTKGSILIQNNKNDVVGLNDNVGIFTIQKSLSHNNVPNKFSCEIQDFEFPSLLPFTDDAPELSTLFGTNLVFDVMDNSSDEIINSLELYIPKPLKIIYDDSSQNQEPLIMANSNISWNADSEYSHDTFIYIVYNPINQSNHSIVLENSKGIEYLIRVNDSEGFYEFQSSDLSSFPKDSKLDLSIIRGSYTIDNETGIALTGFTRVSKKLTLKL